MGGEDFGMYAKTAGVPGYMFSLGSIPYETWQASLEPGAAGLPSLHTPYFAPLPAKTIETGVAAMGAALLDLLAK